MVCSRSDTRSISKIISGKTVVCNKRHAVAQFGLDDSLETGVFVVRSIILYSSTLLSHLYLLRSISLPNSPSPSGMESFLTVLNSKKTRVEKINF